MTYLDPSGGKHANYKDFPPDKIVKTLRIIRAKGDSYLDDEMIGAYAGSAWDHYHGEIGHHWRRYFITEVVEMTVREFLTELWKHRGMNPFEDLNRIEWLSLWQDYHNVKPKGLVSSV